MTLQVYKTAQTNAQAWQTIDNAIIVQLNIIYKQAYPNNELKGYATSTQPATPANGDTYLVDAAGTYWGDGGIAATFGQFIARVNGAWQLLPETITTLHAKILETNAGRSIYDIAVDNGFIGTETEYNNFIANAITAASGAQAARTGAETAYDAAVVAKTGAETAKTGAEAAQQAAALSAAQAAGFTSGMFKGLATTSTTPTVQAGVPQWWLASGPGTYTNFGGLVVAGNFAVLSYSGSAWSKWETIITAPNVVQEPGASTTNVMSQKAITDSLKNYANLMFKQDYQKTNLQANNFFVDAFINTPWVNGYKYWFNSFNYITKTGAFYIKDSGGTTTYVPIAVLSEIGKYTLMSISGYPKSYLLVDFSALSENLTTCTPETGYELNPRVFKNPMSRYIDDVFADGSVVTDKLAAGAVTPNKLSDTSKSSYSHLIGVAPSELTIQGWYKWNTGVYNANLAFIGIKMSIPAGSKILMINMVNTDVSNLGICFFDEMGVFIEGVTAYGGWKLYILKDTYKQIAFSVINTSISSFGAVFGKILLAVGESSIIDGAVSTSKVANKSITEAKTIFFETVIGANKFNYQDNTILSQSYILSGGGIGALGSNVTGFVSHYIPITAGQSLTINKVGVGGGYNAYYNSSKTLINTVACTTSGGKQTLTATQDGYVRFTFLITHQSILVDAQVMVNIGTTALAFEVYTESFKLKSEYIPDSTIADGSITSEKIATGSVIENKLSSSVISQLYKPKLVLPSKVYAVVGDTLQLFYKSFVRSLNDYFIVIDCLKGRNYPRFFEYTPMASDVGTVTMTISLLDLEGNILDTKTLSLITKVAANPASQKNILHVGDSTMQNGQIPIELSRRFKGTTGVATSPAALNLDKFNIVGRLQNASHSVGWEGTGGWTWDNYNSSGIPAIRFGINGITNLNIGDIYRIPRTINTELDPDNYWQFQIQEINVSGGNGNVRAIFSATPYHIDFASEPQAGTWTKQSGTGQNSVSYNSLSVENYQPFYNNTTNQVDFISYVNLYCGGQLDYCFIKLSVNSLIGSSPFTDFTFIINQAKIFINNLHAQIPDCKILIDSGTFASQKGGIGDDYNSSSISGKYGTLGFNLKIFKMIEKYIELCNDINYSSFVQFVPSYMQFDADNAYPNFAKPLNTRASATEMIDSNGVHPSDSGYWMIADALFRMLISLES